MTELIARLFDGPIDIVGDIHGEIAALHGLLGKLGYDSEGRHPNGRRLVFLGDLTDRGPDSPAVLEWVCRAVNAGRAQCLLGNHELNLLRDIPKHGNDWWTRPENMPGQHPAQPIEPGRKIELGKFLSKLPIVLERADLRLVHACWNTKAVSVLRELDRDGASALTLYEESARAFETKWATPERQAALKAESEGFDLADFETQPPFMPLLADQDTEYQMSNPVTVLTSGEEAGTSTPFYAGGRWRMVERVRWWQTYRDEIPVVIGHYWRRYSDIPTVYADKYGPDVFAGIEPHHWMGPNRNVYCVDFSVGGRSEQRHRGEDEHVCQLAALRVPEWEVVHDQGTHWQIGAPGAPVGHPP